MKYIINFIIAIIGALVALLIMIKTSGEFLYVWGLLIGVISAEILNFNRRSKD